MLQRHRADWKEYVASVFDKTGQETIARLIEPGLQLLEKLQTAEALYVGIEQPLDKVAASYDVSLMTPDRKGVQVELIAQASGGIGAYFYAYPATGMIAVPNRKSLSKFVASKTELRMVFDFISCIDAVERRGAIEALATSDAGAGSEMCSGRELCVGRRRSRSPSGRRF